MSLGSVFCAPLRSPALILVKFLEINLRYEAVIMDWACSSNRETGKMNRTLVGKPFGMNRTEVSYEDLNWIEVAQDLVLALLLLLLSFFVSSVSLLFHLCSNVASNNTEHLLHTRFCRFRKIGKSDSYFVMFLCPSVRPSVFLPSVCLSVSVE